MRECCGLLGECLLGGERRGKGKGKGSDFFMVFLCFLNVGLTSDFV